MCNMEWKKNDGKKIIVKIVPLVGVESDIWTILFTAALYDFLKEKFGDVHLWCEQQYNLIIKGQMNFSPTSIKIMKRVLRGEQLSQRKIGDLIRAFGLNLWLDSLDF